MIVILLIVLIPVLVIVVSASVISFVRAFVDRILFYKQIKQICKGKKYGHNADCAVIRRIQYTGDNQGNNK